MNSTHPATRQQRVGIIEPENMKSKLPSVTTTVFTVMSRMAAEHGAINLSQGYPDFDCPQRLRELVAERLNGGCNQYPPMAGVMELRQRIAEKVAAHYGCRPDPETEITVTSGATEAIFDAVQAVVHPGDEVIVFDPAYDSYEPAVHLAGGKTLRLPLSLPDYSIDWELVARAISGRTRMIIVNSPHNPCGSVLGAADLDRLAELTGGRDILVLSDEVYEHMVFDGRDHISLSGHEALRERSFVVFSFGKTYHATGWKLACCIAPPALTGEFRKVHQFVTFTSSSFVQYAIADFLAECPEHALELPRFYQRKRDLFCELLAPSRFRLTPSQGTYFQLADYSAISELDDQAFVNWLTREIGVAAIPLSPFYRAPSGARHIRFCFCKEDATLERAAEILCRL